MTSKLLMCVCAWMFYSNVFSQSKFRITGNVVDPKGELIVAGNVRLFLNDKEEILIEAAAINDGSFSLMAPPNDYLLKLDGLLFQPLTKAIALRKDTTLTVVVNPSSKLLEEVNITGSKPVIENRGGNVLVNIDNTIMGEVPSVTDLFSQLPGIQLSQDKQNISAANGADAILFLDNQRISINELNALSVRDIKDIEMINNPSAKYDADGRIVILIRRKHNDSQGVRTEFSETASIKRKYNNYLSVNSSLRNGKLELTGNVQYNHLKLWEKNDQKFKIENQQLESQYSALAIENSPQFQGGVGAHYQINEEDYFSLNVNGRIRDVNYPVDNISFFSVREQNQHIITNTQNDSRKTYYSANANYSKYIQSIKSKLFAGAQYSKYTENLATNIFNKFNTGATANTGFYKQNFQIQSISSRADFEKLIGKTGKFELGGTISGALARALFDSVHYITDAKTSSVYNYNELIFGAYSQYTGSHDKLNYSVGARIEQTDITGAFKDATTPVIARNLFYVLPKVSVKIPVDSSQAVTFDYLSNVKRPNFSSLNQIVVYLNPFTEYAKNINLTPTVTHEWFIGYHLKNTSIKLSYYYQKDPVYLGVEFDKDRRMITMKNRNYDFERGINLTVTIPFEWKIWTSHNMVTGNYGAINDAAATLTKPKPNIYLSTNNQLALPKKFKLLFSAWFLSKKFTGLYEQGDLSSVSFGLSKSINNWTLSARMNDVFRKLNFVQSLNVNNIFTESTYFGDNREFALTATYSFGKIKSIYKNKDTDINIDRVK